jgi:ribosomal protein L37AE/L43A
MTISKTIKAYNKEENLLGFSMKEEKQYREDSTWLESINKGCCPDCGYDIIKHTISRKCKACSFSIIGDPKLLAYIHKSLDVNHYLPETQCPECHNKEFDIISNEDLTICKACGLVLKGPPCYSGYVKIIYPFGNVFQWDMIYTLKGHNHKARIGSDAVIRK